MSDIAIRCEGLGKQYRIGKRERYVALRDKLTEAMYAPFRKVRSAFSRNGHPPAKSDDTIWALQDASFEIKHGEVVGVIGRNGAGKSTLLKILSRITEPTTGQITIHGRVGSLLEVGTGFHTELTGRENVFLNGAILGMSHAEIRRKFDEVVAFAEIEKFLDTPVKHYSSGMYMRLAFAVAAHLDSEILVVDEVLAVGDIDFQRKCLGKMQDVAGNEGRTVLFVSHNMAAVTSLTTRCIVLNSGRLSFDGTSAAAIEHYIHLGNRAETVAVPLRRGAHTAILDARLLDEYGNATRYYTLGKPLRLEVTFQTDGSSSLSFETFLLDATRHKLALASLHQFHGMTLPDSAGCYRCLLEFEPLWLASGTYTLDLTTSVVNSNWDHYVGDMLEFDVVYSNPGGQSWDFKHSFGYGAFALKSRTEPKFERV